MRITRAQLRKIIREAASQRILLEYEQSVYRDGNELTIVDDEGNEEYLGTVDEYPEYESLPRDGSMGAPYEGGSWGASRRSRGWY